VKVSHVPLIGLSKAILSSDLTHCKVTVDEGFDWVRVVDCMLKRRWRIFGNEAGRVVDMIETT